MRAAARSVVFVLGCTPWMAACLMGAGDDSFRSIGTEGGGAPEGASESGSDASLLDRTNADAAGVDEASGAMPPVDASRAVLDAMSSGGGATDATNPVTTTRSLVGLRVANWSPDAPAVDFCIAPHGSGAFQGPIMATSPRDAGVNASCPGDGSPSLCFPTVSAYSFFAPGDLVMPEYDVRMVVAAPGVDCSLGGLLVQDQKVTFNVSTSIQTATVALIGKSQSPGGGSGLQLLVLGDEAVVPAPKAQTDGDVVKNPFAMRFIHAAPGLPAVDLVPQSGGLRQWSFKGVAFGPASPSNASQNAYQAVQAVSTATLNVQPSAQDAGAARCLFPAPDCFFPGPTITAAAGSVITMVLAGSPSSMGAPLQLLECVDNAGPTNAYSPCKTLSVSTCGNGIVERFEECDCGTSSTSIKPSDPACSPPIAGLANSGNGTLPNICSTTCHLN